MDHVVHSLTGAQYGMWLGQQMSPDVAYTVAQYVDIRGPFDVATMQRATREASDEFLSPFLRVEVDESGSPVQRLDRSIDAAAQVIDLGLADLPEDQRIDAAVLDANLNGLSVSPVADILAERGVPFVFATGYGDAGGAPSGFSAPVIRKPYDVTQVTAAVADLLRPQV